MKFHKVVDNITLSHSSKGADHHGDPTALTRERNPTSLTHQGDNVTTLTHRGGSTSLAQKQLAIKGPTNKKDKGNPKLMKRKDTLQKKRQLHG